MQIIWYGHSCFLIKTSIGRRILINPFDNSIGYDNNFPKCDFVITSTSHFDSSYLNHPNMNAQIINKSGIFDISYFKIEGIDAFHDKCNGLKRGPNIIYIFRNNNYSLCHLGNLGHIPSPSTLEKLKNIDIMFIPIGGHFTLNGFEAAKLCKIVCPKYIIPMQYKTTKTSLYLDDPKNFIISMKHIKKINSNVLDISKLKFNYKSECILLTPPNN